MCWSTILSSLHIELSVGSKLTSTDKCTCPWLYVIHLVPHESECHYDLYIGRVQGSDTLTPTDYLIDWLATTQQSTVLMERVATE